MLLNDFVRFGITSPAFWIAPLFTTWTTHHPSFNSYFFANELYFCTNLLCAFFWRFSSQLKYKITGLLNEQIRKWFLGTNRSACKTWKRKIDKLVSILAYYSYEDDNVDLIVLHWLLSQNYHFSNQKEINNFTTHFNTHSSNVSVGKYMSTIICFNRLKFSKTFHNPFNHVKKWGHHLQTCKLDFNFVDPTQREPHPSMIKWLNYMQNLETLQIQCTVWTFFWECKISYLRVDN